MNWLAAVAVTGGFLWWGRREWRLWREFRAASKSNSSSPIPRGPKKGPPQAEAGTGIEYGGHHLP